MRGALGETLRYEDYLVMRGGAEMGRVVVQMEGSIPLLGHGSVKLTS